jgi:hypothetical protein
MKTNDEPGLPGGKLEHFPGRSRHRRIDGEVRGTLPSPWLVERQNKKRVKTDVGKAVMQERDVSCEPCYLILISSSAPKGPLESISQKGVVLLFISD